MMRITLLIFVSCYFYNIGFGQLENHQKLFFNAKDVNGIQKFFDWSKTSKQNNATEKAYVGMATAMYAELCGGVQQKLTQFTRGKELLNASIESEPNNAELRFLRFSMQCETPWFLNFNSDIEKDANVILKALTDKKIVADSAFWKKALAYMKNTGELSDSQMAILKKYL
ncbi:MAG: hypothetical protein R2809_06940 [Flavobacteriales bacterium]